ncbi:MAG TPA: ATP-dependent DNA helicase RecG [Anaerovoracaceae bacterium]|nr:ATP-dependent DNA helicase RecG [Anaerovoracaceae bacterium]
MSKTLSLGDSLNYINGIGPKKARALNNLGLFNIIDLLNYFPYKYQDRRKVTKIANLSLDNIYLIECTVLNLKFDSKGYKKKSGRLRLICEDKTGKISIVFFNGGYLINTFHKGEKFLFYGKSMKAYSKNAAFKYQFTNPEYIKSGSENDIRCIMPLYRTPKGISQKDFQKWVNKALEINEELVEWIPKDIQVENNMCDIKYAISNIHYPKDKKSINIAKYRLLYGDFLSYKISQKLSNTDVIKCPKLNNVNFKKFEDKVSFKLTKGQRDAVNDLKADLISDKPMNRLLQGDVGSGKTVVSQYAIYMVMENDYQVAYMAPTELLAKQVYESMKSIFVDMGYDICLLTSSVSNKNKKLIKEDIKANRFRLIVGTHSLLQEDIAFNNLSLTIIDEQHRFGVNQRKILKEKSICPNVLVMSATPIPRTLAATVYGDMDFSVINTLPIGRKPIITNVYNESSREKAYTALKKELLLGHQGYVVAPLIEESIELELISVNEIFDELKERYKGFKLGLLHGRLNSEEKDGLMIEFSKGNIDLLVSTIVIEVGIDVKNTTVILIENAERFGLAQLHQLRGRVGRSNMQSYCYLISHGESEISKTRMNAMLKYSSGFQISEEDFKLRGPGDINGTIQHGNNLDIDNFIKYIEILEKAGEDATDILKKDPNLENKNNKLLKEKSLNREVISYKEII